MLFSLHLFISFWSCSIREGLKCQQIYILRTCGTGFRYILTSTTANDTIIFFFWMAKFPTRHLGFEAPLTFHYFLFNMKKHHLFLVLYISRLVSRRCTIELSYNSRCGKLKLRARAWMSLSWCVCERTYLLLTVYFKFTCVRTSGRLHPRKLYQWFFNYVFFFVIWRWLITWDQNFFFSAYMCECLS